MSYSAGAQIPITRTFVQTNSAGQSFTTAIPLVGQVLDNGNTNWVGYDNGTAEYLLTASAANAVETTLADGRTYYYSSGTAPAGYAYLTGTPSATVPSTSRSTGATSPATTTGATTSGTSSRMTTSHTSSSVTGSASPATTTSSAQRLSVGAIFSLSLAMLAAISLNVLA